MGACTSVYVCACVWGCYACACKCACARVSWIWCRRQSANTAELCFFPLLSTLTFLNQLGVGDFITVFNNSTKNEKILKVAIPPERLSRE